MKNLICAVFVSSFLVAIHAQEPVIKTYGKLKMQNQIGFNATDFIKSFFGINNFIPSTITNVPVFSFNYKALFSNVILPSGFKFGLRLGLSHDTQEETFGTDSTHSNFKNNSVMWRAGFEVQQTISKRFVLYYGLDYFESISTNESDEKIVYNKPNPPVLPTVYYSRIYKYSGKLYGGGPLMGVQFNLNKYVSISTETALYLIKGTSSNIYLYSMSDGSVYPYSKQTSTSGIIKQTSIALPSFINLNLMF